MPFLGTLAPPVAAGLGDSKAAVREAASGVLLALMAVDFELAGTMEHFGPMLGAPPPPKKKKKAGRGREG